MITLPEGTRLAYILPHEAWYADAPGAVEGRSVEITASAAPGERGGCAWSFTVEERAVNGALYLELRAFDDAFPAIAQVPEFFSTLGAGDVRSLEDIRDLLDQLGAVDETPRSRDEGDTDG